MSQQMTLKDVARVLRVKPYRVDYALTNGLVEEPALRISNRRIFQAEDVERLARHFGVKLQEQVAG